MPLRKPLFLSILAPLLLTTPTVATADSGAVPPLTAAGTDLTGWRDLPWDTPVEAAANAFGDALRRDHIEVAGCYFSTAVPVTLASEAWEAWLCEDRTSGRVIAVSLEKGYDDMFFDERRTTELYNTFLAEFTERYGPAHEFWEHCHNARWHETIQHRWFFPSTTVSLLLRDGPDRWVSIRFEKPNDTPNFGPGVCVTRPRDLRG